MSRVALLVRITSGFWRASMTPSSGIEIWKSLRLSSRSASNSSSARSISYEQHRPRLRAEAPQDGPLDEELLGEEQALLLRQPFTASPEAPDMQLSSCVRRSCVQELLCIPSHTTPCLVDPLVALQAHERVLRRSSSAFASAVLPTPGGPR